MFHTNQKTTMRRADEAEDKLRQEYISELFCNGITYGEPVERANQTSLADLGFVESDLLLAHLPIEARTPKAFLEKQSVALPRQKAAISMIPGTTEPPSISSFFDSLLSLDAHRAASQRRSRTAAAAG